jgi:iron complex transport system permease protein
MFTLSALLTGLAVSLAGIVGFVGLVSPHIARMLVGGDHRLLLPTSIVIGSNIMITADLAAKSLLMPAELPLGALTAIIGTPFFTYLLVRLRDRYVV